MSTMKQIEDLFSTLSTGDASVAPVIEDAILEGVKDAPKGTKYALVICKGYKRGTHVVADRVSAGQYTVVSDGKIRIVGVYGGKGYDRTFEVGDTVEYDSFNLSYHGKITSIGEKCVTVAKPHSKKSVRMDAYTFSWRNHDLNLAAAFERNSETMMHI